MAITVTDQRGLTLSGIHVSVNGPTTRSGETNASGNLSLTGMMAGTYRLRFDGEMWISFEREVTLRAGQVLDIDVSLNPVPEPPPPPPAPAAPAPVAESAPVGPKGVEPLPSRLKGGSAAVTPRPQLWSGSMRLSRVRVANVVSPFWVISRSVVVLRIELSATWLSAGFGQPALNYLQVGQVGVEPTISCSQGTRISKLSHTPMNPVISEDTGSGTIFWAFQVQDEFPQRKMVPDPFPSQNGRIRTGDLLAPDQARWPNFATF